MLNLFVVTYNWRPTDMEKFSVPYFVKGDFDGLIGLFIDNLINLLIITGLCLSIKMSPHLVFSQILPATALSVLAGNLFYSWQARRVALREKRADVTALPYGINTVTMLAYFSLIIFPVYARTGDAVMAWRVGVMACFVSAVFEGVGAFVGDYLRRMTPRAALLSTLAGIAIAFIALDQTIRIWDKPLVAFIPLALILAEYFSRVHLPFRIPAGLYALVAGGTIAWTTGGMDAGALSASVEQVGFRFPGFILLEIFSTDNISRMIPYLAVAVPMGLMSFFGALQNLESAEAAGDTFPARPVLLMNGIGTLVGALCGSPFPTTVYIGHPGWKALGARMGYSVLNGVVMTLICFTGLMSLIIALVPLEAGYPILLWIGLIITAQAFQSTPREHAPAVALGLMPSIAAWGLSLLRQYASSGSAASGPGEVDSLIIQKLPHLKAIIPFAEGSLFSAMFLSAVGVYLVEKNFLRAFYWVIPLAICSWFGIIHSTAVGFARGGQLPLGYGLFGLVLLLIHFYQKKHGRGQI